MSSLRPFHVTVVEALDKCESALELSVVLFLVDQTEIPSNHDAIVEAIEKGLKRAKNGMLTATIGPLIKKVQSQKH